MMSNEQAAESLPFSRSHLAAAVGESPSKVGNWLDRNQLWQTKRIRGYYRLSDVFDVAGFAALRIAHVPEKDCARYVLNFGFYGHFLHGPQLNRFSYRNGKWDIGVFDPSALVSITLNMRTMAERIFYRISQSIVDAPTDWPEGAFQAFNRYYHDAADLDLLDRNAVPLFADAVK